MTLTKNEVKALLCAAVRYDDDEVLQDLSSKCNGNGCDGCPLSMLPVIRPSIISEMHDRLLKYMSKSSEEETIEI
jgi:hypothetical protein